MEARARFAVDNNISWCAAVCRTHGIESATDARTWGALSPSPAFYPDAITSAPGASIADVLRAVGGRETFSLKDSFADVDLAPLGFGVLFEAQWIYREAEAGLKPLPPDWRVAETEGDFEVWIAANGLRQSLLPALLSEPGVKLMLRERNGARAGCVVSLGGGAAGISNVFAEGGKTEPLWPELADVAAYAFPGVPIVGYEADDDLAAALRSGWTAVGPLRIWTKAGA